MWRMEFHYHPLGDYESGLFVKDYETHAEAYDAGRSLACVRCALAVKVYAPDGSLAHEYHRHDNVWHDHAVRPHCY